MEQKTQNELQNRLFQCCRLFAKKYTNLEVNQQALNKVFDFYHKILPSIHDWMGANDSYGNVPRLDPHKISAALLIAIIREKPLKVNESKLDFVSRTPNEHLGLVFSLYTMAYFLKSKAEKDAKMCESRKYACKQNLLFPQCTEGVYSAHFVKLVKNEISDNEPLIRDWYKNKFDTLRASVFFLSNIFFLIEAYSLQYWETDFEKRSKHETQQA